MEQAFLPHHRSNFFEYFLTKVKIISAGLNMPMLYLNLCWGYSLMTVLLFERTVHTFFATNDSTAGATSWSLPNRI